MRQGSTAVTVPRGRSCQCGWDPDLSVRRRSAAVNAACFGNGPRSAAVAVLALSRSRHTEAVQLSPSAYEICCRAHQWRSQNKVAGCPCAQRGVQSPASLILPCQADLVAYAIGCAISVQLCDHLAHGCHLQLCHGWAPLACPQLAVAQS